MKWPTMKLADAARRIGGGTPSRKKQEFWGGTIPWFTVADLLDVDDVQRLTTSRESITQMGLAKSAAKLVPLGSIVFSSRVVVGKVGIAQNDLVTNQDFSSFVPSNDFEPEFIAYFLIKSKSDFREHQRVATIKGVTTKVIDALDVPVPPLDEQRRIVSRIKECMERADEIEMLGKQVLAEATMLESSLYSAALGDQRLSEVSVGEVILGSRNGRSLQQNNEKANGYVLSLSSVRGINLNDKAIKPIILPEATAASYCIKEGDVFVSRSNTRELVGLASVATSSLPRVIYPDLLIKLEANPERIRSRYLAYALRMPKPRRQIKDRAVGTSQSMVKISGSRLRDVIIQIPSLDAQDSLIERFDQLHNLTISLTAELRSCEVARIREAILRKAFAGDL